MVFNENLIWILLENIVGLLKDGFIFDNKSVESVCYKNVLMKCCFFLNF